MRVEDIKSAMQEESTFSVLFEEYQPCFDIITQISDRLKQGLVMGEPDLTSIIMQLTGVYGSLIPVYNISVATKLELEAILFVQKKLDWEQQGKKVVLGLIEKEVQRDIAPWRSLRAVFESYSQICEKAISSCQSILKTCVKEERLAGQAKV